jgi:hypothetical protein
MITTKRIIVYSLFVWFFSTLLPANCAAQVCLQGTVRDAQGAPALGAQVTALSLATQSSSSVMTNASGLYQFTSAQVPAGSYYEISIYVLGSGNILRQSVPVTSCPATANFNLPLNTVAITVTASGRTFSVDGISFANSQSQTFYFLPGSRVTIGTPEVQTLVGGTRWTFASWSDGGASAHSIVVPSSPSTYTASFSTAYWLTALTLPAPGGTITSNPVSSDWYFPANSTVQLTARPNAGYVFSNWSGYLTGTANPQALVMRNPGVVSAQFTAGYTVTTNPPGLSFSVDGSTYSSAQTFNWAAESVHTIAATTPQGFSTTRYVFANWSDGKSLSHMVTALSPGTTYVANFTTQHLLTTAVTPSGAGTIVRNPGSSDGFYDENANVEITASPASGYVFVYWSGVVGILNPTTVNMYMPRNVTANFAVMTSPTISSLSPSRATAGGAPFTLTVNGSGFTSGYSKIIWNGVPLTTTVVSSTQATAQVDSILLAFQGTASVLVINVPEGTSNAVKFTVDPAPSPTPIILAMTPLVGFAGGPAFDLQVYGIGFVPDSVVHWNGSNRFTVFLSSNQLRATISAADIARPAKNAVTVVSPGVGSSPAYYNVESALTRIVALSPPGTSAGSPEFALTLYGMDFRPDAVVQWNGLTRPTTWVSTMEMRAAISAADVANGAICAVSVLNGDGSRSAARSFVVVTLPPGAPSISRVSPNPVPVGTPAFTLTVYGSGFVAGSAVQWNGMSKNTRYISATELEADILASDLVIPGVFIVRVVNPASYEDPWHEAASLADLTQGISVVTSPVPIITRLTPSSAVAGGSGFQLTIDGYGFVKDTTWIQWNEKKALATFKSATQVTIDVPAADIAGEGTINFVVMNPPPGGGTSDSQTFTMIPSKPPASQLFYPRLMSSAATDATQNTGIAIANLSGNKAAITIRAFGRDGKEIAGPKITNPVSMSISREEQRAITESQVFGSGMIEQQAVGWMKLESSESKLAGFFLVFDNNLQTLDGADVSSTVMTSFVLTEIEGAGFNQLHIANPGSSSATVNFELYNASGSVRATVARTINPNGALVDYMTDLFAGIAVASSDYVRVSSNQGLVPFSYLGVQGHDAKGLNGQDTTKGATTLYSPQYVVGGADWSTTLSIVNLETTGQTTVTLRFIGDDGLQIGATQTRPIAAKGKLYVSAQDFFVSAAQMTQGYIEVKSNGALLAGSVAFGDPAQSKYTAALPLVSTVQKAMVFGQVASGMVGDKSYFTGLALLNPTNADAQVTIELFDRDGRRVTSGTLTIPAGRRRSSLLTEYFPGLTGQNIGSGYIKVTSDRGLASFALFGSLEALSAVPAQSIP